MEKVKVDEFDRVCRSAKLVERNGRVPIFTTLDQKEGLELSLGKIISFWIKNPGKPDQEKVYGQPANDKQIISVIGAFETKAPEPKKEEKKNEQPKSENTEVQKKELVGMMPENLTRELVQKWASISVQERLIMLQNTDPSQIEERKGRAGQKYKYVSISYMIKAANMAFGFAWSVKVVSWIETATEIICNLEITVDLQGKTITKAGIGQKDITFKIGTKELLCKGDDYKACEADGIKKALSLFGIAQDVYSGEV